VIYFLFEIKSLAFLIVAVCLTHPKMNRDLFYNQRQLKEIAPDILQANPIAFLKYGIKIKCIHFPLDEVSIDAMTTMLSNTMYLVYFIRSSK
jgi:hypothetical protein